MMKKVKTFVFGLAIIVGCNTLRAEEEVQRYELNEASLKLLINDSNPNIERINSIYQQNVINETSFNKDFGYQVYAEAKYEKDNDDDRIWTGDRDKKYTLLEGGIRKSFIRGIDANIYLTNDNRNKWTKGYVPENYNLNRPEFVMNFSFDLWKNFLGYHDTARKLSVELNKKESLINSKIQKNNFYFSVRELYWNLVFKQKELEIYKYMVNQAQKNLDNVNKKHKAYIVDRGDVARARAILASRKSSYSSIKSEIGRIKRQLRYYLPELTDKIIYLGENLYIDEAIESAKMCNVAIKNGYGIKKWQELTSYWDYINVIDEVFNADLKSYKRTADFDIKLNAGVSFSGVDNSVSDSYKDLKEFERSKYSIGLTINKTLGENNRNLELEQIKLLKMNYNVNKKNTIADLEAFYYSYSTIIKNLFDNLESLNNYRKDMEERVESSRKKYNQGRVSLNDLIQDEDSLIEASMQIINIESSILTMTLQYLSAFDKVECELNTKL